MVFQLLMFGRGRAEKGAAGLQKVGAVQIELLVDQKVFLFGAQRDIHSFVRQTEALHQTLDRLAQSLIGAQQRGLFIQSFAGVAAKRRGNAQSGAVAVTFDKSRTGGVPCSIAAGFKGTAQTAGGETGSVRFAHNQIFARKGHDRLTFFDFQKGVMFFSRGAVQRQKPVGKVAGAPIHRPMFHRVGHVGGDRRIQRGTVIDRGKQFGSHRFGQIFAHSFGTENIFAEITHIHRRSRHCGRVAQSRYFINRTAAEIAFAHSALYPFLASKILRAKIILKIFLIIYTNPAINSTSAGCFTPLFHIHCFV